MAKLIDYPKASLRHCIDLAKAVDELGGNCTTEMAAHKLGKKVSGSFHTLISAAAKFGLIENKRGKLSTTDTYKEYKLAYTDDERVAVLREIFLTPHLFENVANRFSDQKLPIDFFDKLLVKEFGVQDSVASRVSGYFIDGAKATGILSTDNIITHYSNQSESPEMSNDKEFMISNKRSVPVERSLASEPTSSSSEEYMVKISGPGINSTIAITEIDDLLIVDAMLKKVKNKLAEMPADNE